MNTTNKPMTLANAMCLISQIKEQRAFGDLITCYVMQSQLDNLADAIDAHLAAQREGGLTRAVSEKIEELVSAVACNGSLSAWVAAELKELYTAPPHPRVVPDEMLSEDPRNPYRHPAIHDGFTAGWNNCRAEVLRLSAALAEPKS